MPQLAFYYSFQFPKNPKTFYKQTTHPDAVFVSLKPPGSNCSSPPQPTSFILNAFHSYFMCY